MQPLTPAELIEATGKRQPAAQAAALMRLGIPFQFLGRGRSPQVDRTIALAFALLPERAKVAGVDLSRVR